MVTAAQAKSLRAQLHAAGVFEHAEASSWGKMLICMSVAAAGYAAVILGPLWLAFIAVPVIALFSTTAAMLGHEGSHRSTSTSPRRNALMQHIAFPFFGGLGALHWRNKHDVLHHGHPNVHGGDPDIGLWPMTSCQEDHLKANPVRRWLQRNVQGYIFWPLTIFLPLMMRISSVRKLIEHGRKRGIDKDLLLDAGSQLAHYTVFLIVPTLIWGWSAALVYASVWALVGVMLALIFAPAHIGLPIVSGQNTDWEHQLETTRNLKLPRWLSWFFIGLDYQVEHHLFPKIPHQHLPRASAIVKRWCDEVGLQHRTIAYGPAVIDVTRFLHNAWRTPATPAAVVRAETVAFAAAVQAARGQTAAEPVATSPLPMPLAPALAAGVSAAAPPA